MLICVDRKSLLFSVDRFGVDRRSLNVLFGPFQTFFHRFRGLAVELRIHGQRYIRDKAFFLLNVQCNQKEIWLQRVHWQSIAQRRRRAQIIERYI